MGKIYIGNVGVQIILDTERSLTGATKMEIRCKKPSGRIATWDAAAYNDTSLSYTTVENDLTESGVHYLQTYVEWTNEKLLGATVEIFVYPSYG